MWTQLLLHIGLMLYMFNVIDEYTFGTVLLYGLFLFLSIFAYTSLMDRSFLSIPFEIAKFLLGVVLIFMLGNWFGLDTIVPWGTLLLGIYLAFSLLATFYFYKYDTPEYKLG